MREDDDPQGDAGHGSLADGLGQTPGGSTTSSDPTSADAYGDDSIDDGGYGDGAADGADTADTSDSVDPGDDADGGDDLDPETAELPDDPSVGSDVTEDGSPLDGIGFLLSELRDAVFGEDEAAASGVGPDPADVASDTDLDLTGDGVVDGADLHEAESPFDFGVDGLHGHHGHDGGVIDA